MIQTIYWILAILVMLMLLISTITSMIRSYKNDKEFERYIKEQRKYLRRSLEKMTVAEICKELGYEVEIIKEEN